MIKMRLKVFSLGFCVFIVLFCFILDSAFDNCVPTAGIASKASYTTISVSEAKEKIFNSSDLLVLDVRTNDEFEEGHIRGAYLIPHTVIMNRQDELPDNKSQPILVYCRSGSRSVTASNTLVTLSYTQIYNMAQGFNAWKDAGFPYETGPFVKPSTTSTTESQTDQISSSSPAIGIKTVYTSNTPAFETFFVVLALMLFVSKGHLNLLWRKK